MGVWGALTGFAVLYAAFLVGINRVPEGADTPVWCWAFLLNVAALVAGAGWCLVRRAGYRPFGVGLLAGFLVPYLAALLVSAVG